MPRAGSWRPCGNCAARGNLLEFINGVLLDRFVERRTRLHELQYAATRLREPPAGSILLVIAIEVGVRIGSGRVTGPVGPAHRSIFAGLLGGLGEGHNLIPDAHLAALAIEHGLALCSSDGDFARFPGLRWINPLMP